MRCCAVAGAAARMVRHRNAVAWLSLFESPIKFPVLRNRLEILPEFGAALEPAHQVVEARDRDDGNPVPLLDFPDRREISLASLHPVQRNDHSRNNRPVPFDDVERLAHGGAGGQYILSLIHISEPTRLLSI